MQKQSQNNITDSPNPHVSRHQQTRKQRQSFAFIAMSYFVQHFNCYFHHKQHFVHSQQLTRRAVWESIKKNAFYFTLDVLYSFWFKELEMNVKFAHVFIQTMEVVFVFTQLLNVYNESNFCWRQSQILKDVPDPLWHNFNPTQNNSQKHKNQLVS